MQTFLDAMPMTKENDRCLTDTKPDHSTRHRLSDRVFANTDYRFDGTIHRAGVERSTPCPATQLRIPLHLNFATVSPVPLLGNRNTPAPGKPESRSSAAR
jgi:hypothetical protein